MQQFKNTIVWKPSLAFSLLPEANTQNKICLDISNLESQKGKIRLTGNKQLGNNSWYLKQWLLCHKELETESHLTSSPIYLLQQLKVILLTSYSNHFNILFEPSSGFLCNLHQIQVSLSPSITSMTGVAVWSNEQGTAWGSRSYFQLCHWLACDLGHVISFFCACFSSHSLSVFSI